MLPSAVGFLAYTEWRYEEEFKVLQTSSVNLNELERAIRDCRPLPELVLCGAFYVAFVYWCVQ